jgi:hypothetical protein
MAFIDHGEPPAADYPARFTSGRLADIAAERCFVSGDDSLAFTGFHCDSCNFCIEIAGLDSAQGAAH